MPTFAPFRGMRYNSDAVRLDQVIAPPYDVIGSAERSTLAHRHRANSVGLELPEPDITAGFDRYKVAAGLLERWIHEGILVTDPVPALYPYRMTSPDGRSTTGVIGALGVGPGGDAGDVLPHEETLPKARTDRLDLLRATGTNLSPIWGLSLATGLTAVLDTRRAPVGDAVDDGGVRHQIWMTDDPAEIDTVCREVENAALVIADGHHRYQTARTFRTERRRENGDRTGGYDRVMAYVVELVADQVTVGPIHRTLSGLDPTFDLVSAFSRWFDAVRAGPAEPRVVGALGESSSLALVTAQDAWLLTPRTEAYDAAGNDLDTGVVGLVLAELPEHVVTHRHSWQEACSALEDGTAQAAVFLRPVSVAQIAEWAGARRKMPPKTSYFSPKPRTGMVFRRLSD
ncbi:MAG: DUF1015 family protein [Acidimicrobiales bacterium]